MKILIIHNTYQQPGGEDVVCEQESRLLQERGHQVIAYRRSNHEIERLSAIGRLAMPFRMTWARDSQQEIREVIRRHKPDLAHVHNTFLMISPSVYSACREARVPVVQTVQNYRLLCPGALFFRDSHVCEECSDHGLSRAVWHGCYRDSHAGTAAVALMLKTHRLCGTWTDSVDAYVVATEFARQKFIDSGLPAKKIYAKPNFVSPDPGERATHGEYALFAGRLSREKGLATLLEAWKRLSVAVPLVIVGDGPLRPELEAEIQRNDLRHVRFTGRMNGTETRAVMKNAAFLVLPSLWYEGFPMVMAESIACGTPVLGSRLGAMQEVIRDGHTGLHFTPGDSADLTEKVTWAWTHRAELAEMGHQARADYENHYTPAVNYSLLMEIYQETLTRSHANSHRRTSSNVA